MLPAQRRLLERRGGDVGSGGSEECCKGSDGGREGLPSPHGGVDTGEEDPGNVVGGGCDGGAYNPDAWRALGQCVCARPLCVSHLAC
jgi:hypothetical protein